MSTETLAIVNEQHQNPNSIEGTRLQHSPPEIDLYGNPIQCDQQLIEVAEDLGMLIFANANTISEVGDIDGVTFVPNSVTSA